MSQAAARVSSAVSWPRHTQDTRRNNTDVLWNFVTSLTSSATTVALPDDVEVVEGQTYTWEVFAIDSGGLQSNNAIQTVTVTPFDGVLCDFLPPTGTISTAITSQGY